MTTTSRWYLAYTHARSEAKAGKHLERQKFQTYIPKFKRLKRVRQKIKSIDTPLFARYIFIKIDMNTQRWRSISSTVGIHHLICNGDMPVPVSSDVIAALEAREVDGFINLDDMKKGDPVRVVDGVFESFTGLFDGYEGTRTAVLLNLLGRQHRIVLDSELVTAA